MREAKGWWVGLNAMVEKQRHTSKFSLLLLDLINWLNPLLCVAKVRSTFEVDKNGGIVNKGILFGNFYNLIEFSEIFLFTDEIASRFSKLDVSICVSVR
jgi:hypothetical protein